jgi:hypothetical protein
MASQVCVLLILFPSLYPSLAQVFKCLQIQIAIATKIRPELINILAEFQTDICAIKIELK